jgi:hypothetical protein
MPSATPLPRGPSRLALFGAEDLLGYPGCPACHYVAEADDRFLGWFALEAHADPGLITRLCQSLGPCPRHTRALLAQPGAETRLTAVYRYLLRAAADYLAAGTSPRAACPGCIRAAEAEQRALDTLLTGLREDELRERYRDADGLCLPHLRAAVPSAGRRLATWLAGDMLARLAGGSPRPTTIAGDADHDAEIRVRLRAALPAGPPPSGGPCRGCLAVALAERDGMAETDAVLCPPHLREACAGAAGGDHAALSPAAAQALKLYSERSVSWLIQVSSGSRLGTAARKLTDLHRAGAVTGECPACRAAAAAAKRWLAAWPTGSAAGQAAGLCLWHVISLRRRDPGGTRAAVRAAADATAELLADLDEAFGKRVWSRRHEPRGREMTAWLHAASLIDGRVFGGGPVRPLSPRHSAAIR